MTVEELDNLMTDEIMGYWPQWCNSMGDKQIKLLRKELKQFDYYPTRAALEEYVKSRFMKKYPAIIDIVATVREYHNKRAQAKRGTDPVALFEIAREDDIGNTKKFYATDGVVPGDKDKLMKYAHAVAERHDRLYGGHWLVFILGALPEKKTFEPATREQIAELEEKYGWPPRPNLKDVPGEPNLQNKKIHEQAKIYGIKK
jgi:hypothetical protein